MAYPFDKSAAGPDRKAPVLVPKGTTIAYSVYTMHRRPDLYGMDADCFNQSVGTRTCR